MRGHKSRKPLLLQGTSLGVQWLGLRAPSAAGPGSIPGWETRSHVLQPRWRIPCAATNTLHIKKKKKSYSHSRPGRTGGRGQNWGHRRGRFTGRGWGVYSHREEQPLADPL